MAGPPTARVPVVIDTSRLTPQVVALREFGLSIAAACDRYLEVFVDAPGVPDAAVLSVVPDVAPTSSGTTDTLADLCSTLLEQYTVHTVYSASGTRCLRTGWIPTEIVDGWRRTLAEARA